MADKQKRVNIEGFDYSSNSKLPKLVPNIRTREIRTAGPIPGSNIQTDPIIHCRISSSSTQLIRLTPRPFNLTYQITKPNPAYVEGSVAIDTKDERVALIPPVKGTAGDNYYLNWMLGGASFFSSCDCSLNSTLITGKQNLKGVDHLYTALSNYFSTKQDRIDEYGEDCMIHTGKDRDFGVNSLSEKLIDNLESTNFQNKHNPVDITNSFSMEGIFPCTRRNPAMMKCGKGVKNETMFLPPNTVLDLSLHKMNPIYAKIETGMSDANYQKSEEQEGAKDAGLSKLEVTFKKFNVSYEVIELFSPGELIAIFKKQPVLYYHDICNSQLSIIPPSVQQTETVMLIPEKTKMVYAAFCYRWQLWHTDGKTLSTRMEFPSGMKKISISLPGREKLIAENFETIAGELSFSSTSSHIYHTYLRQNKITDDRFDSFFPKKYTTNRPYKQAFLLNLTENNISSSTTLTFDIIWDSDLSPKHLYLVLFTLQEGCTIYRDNSRFETTIV
jgi:hypothetical protein